MLFPGFCAASPLRGRRFRFDARKARIIAQLDDQYNVEVTETTPGNIRIAGLMHEPEDGSSIVMAGPMGMVKLFVRTGVQVVQDVYRAYQERLEQLGATGKSLAVAIVHHANYKINKLKEKHLQNEGIVLPMPN